MFVKLRISRNSKSDVFFSIHLISKYVPLSYLQNNKNHVTKLGRSLDGKGKKLLFSNNLRLLSAVAIYSCL